MVSILEAKNILLQNIRTLETVTLPLLQAQGMVLAGEVKSCVDVPSFDNSAMDGYALKYEAHLLSYRITQRIQAGEPAALELESGEAAQIFTGAPIPKNADTVIPRELISITDGKINFESKLITRGMHIRKKATQNAVHDVIARPGTIVSHGVIALLASCGIQNVCVFRRPIVSYIITGNELVEPGFPLGEGSIYNSNGPAIHAFLQGCGIQTIHTFSAPDQKNKLIEKIQQALKCSDLILLTGGVSAGDYDYVPEVLEELGVIKLFHKVKQKPGKPIFSGMKENCWIFGLPGNPASVLACLNQYVKPCLFGVSGYTDVFNQFIWLPLSHTWSKKSGLSHILKAKMQDQKVQILDRQESFNLLPFQECNGFVLIDEDVEVVEEGTLVKMFPF